MRGHELVERFDENMAIERLDDEVGGADLEGFLENMFLIERADHADPCFGVGIEDSAQAVQAVVLRHDEIERASIGTKFEVSFDRLLPIGCFTGNFPSSFRGGIFDHLADDDGIVGDE